MKTKILKCKRCGFLWQPRVKNPKRCPNCKSAYWNVEKTRVPRSELEQQTQEG